MDLRARAAAFWHFLNGTEGEFRDRVLRSGFWVVASSIGIRLMEFTRSIILARLLMPEVFGLMGIAAFILGGLDALTETGYGAALIHRQEKSQEVYDTSWVIAMVRGAVLASGVMAGGLWLYGHILGPGQVGLPGLVARVGLGVVIYAGCLLLLDRSLLARFKAWNRSVTE